MTRESRGRFVQYRGTRLVEFVRSGSVSQVWLAYSRPTDSKNAVFISGHGESRVVCNRQKVDGFLRRSTRARFCSRNEPNLSDICLEADQNLFRNVLHNPQHVLHQLLPPVSATSHSYSLRTRTHDRQLPDRLSRLADCNFITLMLFYQSY